MIRSAISSDEYAGIEDAIELKEFESDFNGETLAFCVRFKGVNPTDGSYTYEVVFFRSTENQKIAEMYKRVLRLLSASNYEELADRLKPDISIVNSINIKPSLINSDVQLACGEWLDEYGEGVFEDVPLDIIVFESHKKIKELSNENHVLKTRALRLGRECFKRGFRYQYKSLFKEYGEGIENVSLLVVTEVISQLNKEIK